jgi:diacylglycerol kinase
MNLKQLFKSIRYAGKGLVYAFTHEQNFRIQIIFAVLIIGAMFLFGIRTSEKIVVLLLITLVIILELLNTAIEKFMDLLKPRLHEYVEVIKDVMAAAVFVASLASLISGLIIFVPYIISFFSLV